MGGSAHLSFTLGVLTAAGGIAGFLKAKSKPSLVAGLGIGGLFLLSGVIIQKGSDKEGHLLALATSALLVGGTAPRIMDRKAGAIRRVPAVAASVGVLSAVYQAKKTMEWWG